MFNKILIANRGEIAVRVARACREMGISSVAVFSEADRSALHVRVADEAYPIGPAPSRESYLCIDKILDVARRAHCDAVHPGYGFHAENPEFARACATAGLTFIGPSPEAMSRLGSKTAARQLAARAGVAMVPGVQEAIESAQEAARIAQDIGYPVLLKAVAGGGGKGMRVVTAASELPSAWRNASSEALHAFGDGRVYLERYLPRPRHIEIQIFGDLHGNFVHLGERECSVQRRHQKVIEESPSPFMTPDLRRAMGEAAVALAKAAGYSNAGTVEFLVDSERNFYFLEVNTRLQVEHPVTECVTGLDLVKLQIRIADGEPLPFVQDEISVSGHAMECRIYAEDPQNIFFPSPGLIRSLRVPGGPGIRLDDGVYEGATVSTEYDPLLGKLIAWGRNRTEAIARLKRALAEYSVTGIKTNVSLFVKILNDPGFVSGEIFTRWLDERLPEFLANEGADSPVDSEVEDAAILTAMLHFTSANQISSVTPMALPSTSGWRREGRLEQLNRKP